MDMCAWAYEVVEMGSLMLIISVLFESAQESFDMLLLEMRVRESRHLDMGSI